jgi:hypothetical protein
MKFDLSSRNAREAQEPEACGIRLTRNARETQEASVFSV